MKRHLTKSEEFDIMKIVLDKFLLLGAFLLGYGIFKIVEDSFLTGLIVLLSGAVIMVIFTIIMVKEYEFIKI